MKTKTKSHKLQESKRLNSNLLKIKSDFMNKLCTNLMNKYVNSYQIKTKMIYVLALAKNPN